MAYIYKITNLINNKIYIGQTVDSVEYRLQEHIWDAYRWERNPNKKFNSRLYPAIIKYGEHNFKIEVIHAVANPEDLNSLEQYYINQLQARDPKIGYNIAEGGNKPPSRLGWHPSEETRLKQSKVQQGKCWYHNDTTEIMVFKGDTPPEGFVKGRLPTQGFKSGEANPQFGKLSSNHGKPLSDRTKQKLSQTKRNNNKNKKKVWYTNGQQEILVDLNCSPAIPVGFVRGRLFKPNNNIIIAVKDILSNEEYLFNSYTEACSSLDCSFPTLQTSCKQNKLLKKRYQCKIVNKKENS